MYQLRVLLSQRWIRLQLTDVSTFQGVDTLVPTTVNIVTVLLSSSFRVTFGTTYVSSKLIPSRTTLFQFVYFNKPAETTPSEHFDANVNRRLDTQSITADCCFRIVSISANIPTKQKTGLSDKKICTRHFAKYKCSSNMLTCCMQCSLCWSRSSISSQPRFAFQLLPGICDCFSLPTTSSLGLLWQALRKDGVICAPKEKKKFHRKHDSSWIYK